MTITKSINDEEMDRARNQFEAGMLMSKEKSSVRVGKMIGSLMTYGRVIDDDEVLNIVKNLTKQDIMEVMLKVLSGTPTLAVYGDVKHDNADILLNGF